MTEYFTPGNVHNLELAVVVSVFVALEIRFKFWKKINSRIGDFFGRPLPTAYVLSWPFLVWFWLSLLLFVDFDTSIINLRAFNFAGNGLGTGHWFSWATIASIVTAWGYDNILGGAMVVGIYASLHEAFWYFFYFLVYPDQFSQTLPFYLPFVILGAVLSVSYALLARNGSIKFIPAKVLIITVLLFMVFDSLWALAGFPVTVSLTTGYTQFFLNLQTNLIEDQSWVCPAIPLILSAKKYLEAKTKK